MNTPSAWRLLIRSYPCDRCGAGPGDPCVTDSGHETAEHAARTNQIGHCPKCGLRVDADTEPGALCDRCALLRKLNTERASPVPTRRP